MKNIQNLFLPYELAVIAKEKGFDAPCFGFYNLFTDEFCYNSSPSSFSSKDVQQAPLYSQILNYLEENHKLFVYPKPSVTGSCFFWEIINLEDGMYLEQNHVRYDNLTDALKNGIEAAFEFIKKTSESKFPNNETSDGTKI